MRVNLQGAGSRLISRESISTRVYKRRDSYISGSYLINSVAEKILVNENAFKKNRETEFIDSSIHLYRG